MGYFVVEERVTEYSICNTPIGDSYQYIATKGHTYDLAHARRFRDTKRNRDKFENSWAKLYTVDGDELYPADSD